MDSHQRSRGVASRTLLIVLVALVAAGVGLWLGMKQFGLVDTTPDPTPQREAMKPRMQTVRLIVPPRALPAWQLRLSDGGTATPATLQGHWTLVFLGFTHCPDVCPTTLAELSKSQKQWAERLPEDKRPRLMFVTVDPERDTPQVTGDYAHYFSADTIAASPTPEQLAAFAKTLGLVYMKVSEPDGSYSMDHSATLVLLDPQGRQAGLLSPPLDPQKIADDLRVLAEQAP